MSAIHCVLDLKSRNMIPMRIIGAVLLLSVAYVHGSEPALNATADQPLVGAGTSCPCGYTYKPANRIVGGEETGINEYTYMVILLRRVSGGLTMFCGGSIISPWHIITAAHCTSGQTPQNIVVSTGEHDWTAAGETQFQSYRNVRAIRQHPLYNPTTTRNDISILVLDRAITFNQAVGPVCMPTGRRNLVGQTVRVTGWGRTVDKGQVSRVLMKLDYPVIPLRQCAQYYGPSVSTSVPTQTCTYMTGKGTCQGDSGGPLAWLDPSTNRYELNGLVSFGGRQCAGNGIPTVNTDVSAYVSWVQSVVSSTAPLTGGTRQRTCSRV